MVSEEKTFQECGRRTDDEVGIHYKLTYKPKGSGELKIKNAINTAFVCLFWLQFNGAMFLLAKYNKKHYSSSDKGCKTSVKSSAECEREHPLKYVRCRFNRNSLNVISSETAFVMLLNILDELK